MVNKKHKKIYAGIRAWTADKRAVVDVIDIATHKRVRSVAVHHPVHNTYVTPDDNFVIAGLSGEVQPGEPTIQVIDPVTDQVVWGMELTGHQQYGRNNHEVRPMAFEANADGSTKRMFAQATGINAVWVIDWNKRQVVDMLWPPKLPLWKQNADGIQTGDMHGLEVLPDRSAVWASSRLDSRIYGWTLPDLKYIGAVEVGPTANWMTPTPDSKFMYVRDLRIRPHRRRGPEEAGDRRQDQDRRPSGPDQHGDPAARPRQRDARRHLDAAGRGVAAMKWITLAACALRRCRLRRPRRSRSNHCTRRRRRHASAARRGRPTWTRSGRPSSRSSCAIAAARCRAMRPA